MQVEYEDPNTIAPPTGINVMPVQGYDNSSEEEEEEEVQQEDGGLAKQQKPKRIIKQRQSLSEKQPGTTIFPTSRIKKIIKADKDLDMMTAEAVFMVGVATEYFIKHFMEEGYTKARLDRRKLVTYKDIVSRSDEFDFLRDVIPMPMPMSEALELRKQKMIAEENPTVLEDMPLIPSEGQHDDYPPLAISSNPLFPNAIIRKPPNTHAKTAQKGKPAAPASGSAPTAIGGKSKDKGKDVKETATAPKSLPTRSSRRSLAASEAVQPEVVADEAAAEQMEVDEV